MKKVLYILLAAIALGSCTTAKQLNYLQDKEPHYAMSPFEDYKLQKNDEVYCSILTKDSEFADEFNQFQGVVTSVEAGGGGLHIGHSYTIYENGYISIPFFGDIKVLGMTIPEAEDAILKKMREAIPDAQVRVSLKNNMFYVVSSDGNRIGSVYKDNMTIYQALAVSGDMSKNITVDLSKVKIVRMGEDGHSMIKTFDLRNTSVIESEFYYIKPNDVLYYSKSPGSFFRITSVWSFVSTILLPLSFAAYLIAKLK